MSTKRKTTSSKENWQAIRARYTWYLRRPFDIEFDRSNWWEGQSETESGATLYELARRHPLVGEGLLKRMPSPAARAAMYADVWGHDDPTCPPVVVESRLDVIINEAVAELHEPRSLYWTCRVGLKSWAKLDYTERSNWKHCIRTLKGLDFRSEWSQCRSINELAHWKITGERKAALLKKGHIKDIPHELPNDEWEAADKKNLSVLHNDLDANPPTPEEWEAAIGYQAIEAHRRGDLLLEVAPDLHTNKAPSLLEKVYRSARRRYGRPKQRARWENWLPLIAEFEDAETTQKAYAQTFARYRRVLDGIQFERVSR